MQILYIINSYPGNGFSFQNQREWLSATIFEAGCLSHSKMNLSIECIIAKMTNLGTELLLKSKK